MAPETATIPAAPAMLPAKQQAQWKRSYAEAFEQAKADEPEDPARQHQLALREANRLLRAPKLESYRDAMALEEWQFILRGEQNGELKVMTMDGKKYSFPVPAGRAAAAESKDAAKK